MARESLKLLHSYSIVAKFFRSINVLKVLAPEDPVMKQEFEGLLSKMKLSAWNPEHAVLAFILREIQPEDVETYLKALAER